MRDQTRILSDVTLWPKCRFSTLASSTLQNIVMQKILAFTLAVHQERNAHGILFGITGEQNAT
jgi:hypothetical protein